MLSHSILSMNSVPRQQATTRRQQQRWPLPISSVPVKSRTSRPTTQRFLDARLLSAMHDPSFLLPGHQSRPLAPVPRSNSSDELKRLASAEPIPRPPRIPASVPPHPTLGPPEARHRDTPSPLLARKHEWMNSFPPSMTLRSRRQNFAQRHT